MLKNLPNEQSTEDLLKLANEKTEKQEETAILYPNDVLTFFSQFQIKSGNYKITVKPLYMAYTKWSKNPVSNIKFKEELYNYFDFCKKRTTVYFYLSKRAFEIAHTIGVLFNEKKRNTGMFSRKVKNFETFISNFNIKEGTYFVDHFVIFRLYTEWANEHQKPIYGLKAITNLCKIYFQMKQRPSKKLIWFGVDKSLLDYFSYTELQQLRKEYNEKIKQKKPGKVSRVEAGTES